MKKVLLLFISLFLSNAVFAYQTVLVNFPPNQGWHADYYSAQHNEAILQYVPVAQTAENWTKTLVFHSYKNLSWTNNAAAFMDRIKAQMELQNSSGLYKYTKYTNNDSIAVRCVQKNVNIPTQCEIYRVSKSFDGLISMHYINKNIQDFRNSYDMWYQIIADITIYQSYYRGDRIMDKATSFEL